MSCAKTAEPIEMMFGMWSWVGQESTISWRCTLASPGEYDWIVASPPHTDDSTVFARWRQCASLSSTP